MGVVWAGSSKDVRVEVGDFGAFYEASWVAAVRTVALLTQDRSVAEEVVQEAMAELMVRATSSAPLVGPGRSIAEACGS